MEISEIRSAYANALSGLGVSKLAKNLDNADFSAPDKGLALAYRASTEALMAKEAWLPPAKLTHISKAADLFRQAVEASPKDPEIRMLRILVEQAIPVYLGFAIHHKEDKAVIFENLSLIPAKNLEKSLYSALIGYFSKTTILTSDELAKLSTAFESGKVTESASS